jgi:predicted enzyme related to lactoylglutathione lyase
MTMTKCPLFLAISAALFLAIASTEAAPPEKPFPADVGAGRVAWFDITTNNLARSKEFYGRLFDWTFLPIDGTDLAVTIASRGTSIGSIRVAEGAIGGFNGVVYVQVPDIQAACAKAKELGATIEAGFPFNLSTRIGAIAVFRDPVGHPLGMYSRTPLPEATSPR